MKPPLRQVPRTFADHQNAKGPAEAATSPSRGSTIPEKEKEMNRTDDSTGTAEAPAPSYDPYEAGPFRCVTDMETPLTTISDLLRGLCLIAETFDEHHGRVVQRIAMLAEKECDVAEELRCKLFHMTHPHPENYVRERSR
ncbi:hypothetical protein P7F60_04885 [Rhizobium sp. YJ-22]|uniref:hypothetical protein n=1 Tax=Rhizobium sp. YJ-22 TaxID=3037556 RepID=UPI0024126C1B|nr:hypothetical protein [Rhizobium sp. YJ-22]MDG3575710.1 hypothetical protein [Rhizobium sp. YJ-22]